LRNIQQCGVSNDVRKKMRSLVCMEHSHWEATIQEIEDEGGKAAKGTGFTLKCIFFESYFHGRLGRRQSQK
jgi:hypothetical protein